MRATGWRALASSLAPALLASGVIACASRQPAEESGPPVPTVRGGERLYAPTGPGQRLEQLARSMAHDELESVNELDRAFAHARAALVR